MCDKGAPDVTNMWCWIKMFYLDIAIAFKPVTSADVFALSSKEVLGIYQIIESFRLEKTLKLIESNC